MSLGHRVKDKRTAKKLTQQKLGEQVGYEQDEISKLERGYIKDISAQRLRRLAIALETSADWLLELETVGKD